ncbi:hypothetical protein GGD81_004280 [Rhodobium orientis]|uniref:Uncharacterized protein n=1 Tax=Rhodobium orientis TaxID=34017 RepID=A0A327JMU4_9HYPH|nr:hypothetical protein [Rhodobium orientis]MBB4305211.1 hypothetical protein [Rhodobium orientis]MBK5948686.1 hypothetical protein [Rhodobium orientis]RAI26693.1 hypothetical protein CH339_13180 [Rhodobium orientis]
MRWFAAFLFMIPAMPAMPALAAEMVPVAAVSSFAQSTMDGDLFRYRAVLVEVDDGADLYIFADKGDGMELFAHAPSIAWRGDMFGQEPRLEVAANTSLRVISENSSVGRDRWEQVLTIAYRDKRFVVAGYTYSHYDTLDPAATGKCDVNLLSGRGIQDGRTFRTSMTALPVDEWTMDTSPPGCSR